jgi:hypothetical protein
MIAPCSCRARGNSRSAPFLPLHCTQVPAPWWIKGPFWLLCVVLDLLFSNRPIQVCRERPVAPPSPPPPAQGLRPCLADRRAAKVQLVICCKLGFPSSQLSGRQTLPLKPQRFWVLETVARIPYFSAISLLHLYGGPRGCRHALSCAPTPARTCLPCMCVLGAPLARGAPIPLTHRLYPASPTFPVV